MTDPGPLDIPDLYDPSIVTVLRLPIAVSELERLTEALIAIYGLGLTVSGNGHFFVIRTPAR